MARDGVYFIGKVAKLVELDAKTIRYYEQVGIIPKANRRAGEFSQGPGYRVYTAEDIERLRFVKIARHLDLPLKDIKKLLQAVEDGCCGRAGPRFLEFISTKLAEVEKQRRELRLLRDRLMALKKGTEGIAGLRRQQKACPSVANPTECVIGRQNVNLQPERR